MNFEVALGGQPLAWCFRDSARLQQWVDACPWQGSGGACVVRTPGASCGEMLLVALRRAIFAADAGASRELRVVMLSGEALAGGIAPALSDALGIPLELPRREWQRILCDVLNASAYVFVAPSSRSAVGTDLWGEAQETVDMTAKAAVHAPFTIVVVDHPSEPIAAQDAFDFSTGGPATGVLAFAETERPLLWEAYVHVRIAWDCGGNLARAVSSTDGLLSTIAEDDDEGLERALLAQGLLEIARVAPETPALIERYLASSAIDGRSPGTVPPPELVDLGVIWTPLGTHIPRVAGWAARAILSRELEPARRWYLRSCLVCTPLASELLAQCLELEGHARARLGGRLSIDSTFVPRNVRSLFESFRQGDNAATWYPAAHPDRPTGPGDEWCFASFGEFLKGALPSRGGPVARALERLTRLRNAIAHCHYVCWAHVRELQKIRRVLFP